MWNPIILFNTTCVKNQLGVISGTMKTFKGFASFKNITLALILSTMASTLAFADADGNVGSRGGIIKQLTALRNCIYATAASCPEANLTRFEYLYLRQEFLTLTETRQQNAYNMYVSNEKEYLYEEDITILKSLMYPDQAAKDAKAKAELEAKMLQPETNSCDTTSAPMQK